jgi:hypothetical protein
MNDRKRFKSASTVILDLSKQNKHVKFKSSLGFHILLVDLTNAGQNLPLAILGIYPKLSTDEWLLCSESSRSNANIERSMSGCY